MLSGYIGIGIILLSVVTYKTKQEIFQEFSILEYINPKKDFPNRKI
jgi:hypothetical protein